MATQVYDGTAWQVEAPTWPEVKGKPDIPVAGAAGSEGATAVGLFSSAPGDYSTALGRSASSAGDYSTALGYHAVVADPSHTYSVAIGYSATTRNNQIRCGASDMEVSIPGKLVLNSPDGNEWVIGVTNAGTLTITAR